MKKNKDQFSLIGFFFKSVILPIWVGIFAYPAIWQLSINDSIHRRYAVWKRSPLRVDEALLPFADILHRLQYPIHNASIKGKLDRLQGLPSDQLQLETLDTYSMTPIAYPVFGANTDEVEFYINAGTNINTPLANGESALFLAIRRGYEPIAIKLLDAGGSLDARGISGTPAIHLAVQCKMLKLVRKAILNKQNIDARDAKNLTTLDHAITSGSLSMVYEIAMSGVPIDFSVTPNSTEISGFLLRWQKTGDPRLAIMAETNRQFDPQSFPIPAELPVNIKPNTFIEIRGK